MESIIEGFICPQCFQVLQSPSLLLEHFEVVHSEDKFNKIKGFLGKWLLGQESESYSSNDDKQMSDMLENVTFQAQEPGITKSHTDYFKEVKDKRVDRLIIETNKRIIRLGKLVQYDPNKHSNRRDYEKSIVSWASDSDTKACGSCGRSFIVSRRKHHCRICGRIICSKCSHYLPYQYAAKISQNNYDERIQFFEEENLRNQKDIECMRCCQECQHFIQRKLEQIKFKNYKPPIILLYKDVKCIMDSAINALPEYTKLATSLMIGGSKNDLIKMQELQNNIIAYMDRIQTLSKRISDLDDSSSLKLQSLKHSMSSNISSQLQNISKHLVPIPSEAQLEELRLQRKKRMQQLDEQQRKNMATEINAQPVHIPYKHMIDNHQTSLTLTSKNEIKLKHRRSKSSEGVLDVGWQPRGVPRGVLDQEGDPFQQQIGILRWFINEARQAGRMDEVESLRRELRMLEQASATLD